MEKKMREVRKSIKRATKEAARAAMASHIKIMAAKGWALSQEFEGDAGMQFECIAYFTK